MGSVPNSVGRNNNRRLDVNTKHISIAKLALVALLAGTLVGTVAGFRQSTSAQPLREGNAHLLTRWHALGIKSCYWVGPLTDCNGQGAYYMTYPDWRILHLQEDEALEDLAGPSVSCACGVRPAEMILGGPGDSFVCIDLDAEISLLFLPCDPWELWRFEWGEELAPADGPSAPWQVLIPASPLDSCYCCTGECQ